MSDSSNKQPILVSIITICFNEEQRISKTLLSIVSQSYPHTELIVIDGASTDSTLDKIRPFKTEITHLVSEEDDGIYCAMNKGISLATGDYVIFMNGGDEFYNEDVLNSIFGMSNVFEGILYGDTCNVIPDSGKESIVHLPNNISLLFLTNNSLGHQSIFVKLSLINKLGGFTTKYQVASDYDMIVRAILVNRCPMRYIPYIVSKFYLDGISSSMETRSVMREERLQVQYEYFPRRLYYFSKIRYWMISNKSHILFPMWSHKIGNAIFRYFFKPEEKPSDGDPKA